MLKISYAGCPGLSLAISAQFTLEMCFAAENCKKPIKTPYFGGLRSLYAVCRARLVLRRVTACGQVNHLGM